MKDVVNELKNIEMDLVEEMNKDVEATLNEYLHLISQKISYQYKAKTA